MRKRLFRVMTVVACGCSFQLIGCESQQIADILASSVKNTFVEVGTFVVESAVENAYGLNQ